MWKTSAGVRILTWKDLSCHWKLLRKRRRKFKNENRLVDDCNHSRSDKGEFKQVTFYAFSPPLLPHLTRLGHLLRLLLSTRIEVSLYKCFSIPVSSLTQASQTCYGTCVFIHLLSAALKGVAPFIIVRVNGC